MSLQINTKMVGEVVVVQLVGRLTLGDETGRLRSVIADLVKKGYIKLLLNLEQLEYADSAGLGELVGVFTTVRNAGGAMKLVSVGGRALDLLQLTRLATLFEFFDSESAALVTFD